MAFSPNMVKRHAGQAVAQGSKSKVGFVKANVFKGDHNGANVMSASVKDKSGANVMSASVKDKSGANVISSSVKDKSGANKRERSNSKFCQS